MKRRSYTAIETLLTIGVIGIAAGISVPMYRNYQIRSDLDLGVVQTVYGLNRSQLLSQTGEQDGMWGFHVEEGTVFLGEAYAVRDEVYDEAIPLPVATNINSLAPPIVSEFTT